MTTTSPSLTRLLRMASTASSWDSSTTAGPLNVQIDSSTPAVFTMQPSSARLPYSTARPPSTEYACSTLRMQPPAASVSRVSQRSDCEKAVAERTQPGAAWNSSTASGEGEPPRMSQVFSHSSSEEECTVCTSSLSSPPRYSSPRMAGTPPARWTSSM